MVVHDGKPMNRSSSTERLTEEQIEDALPSASRRLSDGGGLSVLIKPNGDKYFQFRSIIDGKERSSLLGKYPEMSLDTARKRAKRMCREVQGIRRARKQSLFSSRLSDEHTKEGGKQALDMRDIGDILRGLERDYGDRRIDVEVQLAIQVLVHLPVALDELMSARKSDINLSTGEWRIREMHDGTAVATQPSKLAVIPYELIDRVRTCSFVLNNTNYVFPRLSQLGKKSQSREIRLALKMACPHQSIRLGDFRSIFRRTAEKKSYFKTELIMETLNHSEAKNGGNRDSYLLQRTALSNWWANEVYFARFASGISACR